MKTQFSLSNDVGAGGLSNAMPWISARMVNVDGKFDLRSILCDEKGMSPLEIWCNESQERYVLAVAPEKLELLPHFVSVSVRRLRSLVRQRKRNI